MKTKLSSLTRLALLAALALLLFTVESALPPPVPIPGVKLGLANVVTVWALYHCSVMQTALVLFARVLLASFFSGAASALLFSLAGGILCLCGSLTFRHLVPRAPMWLTSALGGALHNLGQLAAAVSIARSGALWSYLPFLLLAGLICGTLTGGIAQFLTTRLIQIRLLDKEARS